MSEDAVKAAFERRRPSETPNADAAKASFEDAADVFTTCRQCGRRARAKRVEARWTIVEHECGTEGI